MIIKFFAYFSLSLSLIFGGTVSQIVKKTTPMPCLFIHKIAINNKSQRYDRNPPPLYRYALIRGCPANEEEQQMAIQTISLQWEGKEVHQGLYELKKIFTSYEDAYTYALMNNIPITSEREGYDNVLNYVPNLRENGLLPNDIRIDKVIQAIENTLPTDWELVQTEEDKKAFPQRFTLRAKYEVWETRENLINAPVHIIKEINSPEYYTKKGKKNTPFIQFALHQPWRKIELENIEYDAQNWQYFYANAQYFGLKVIDFAGIEGEFIQIHLPDNVSVTPFQVYDKIYQLLKLQTLIGTAQRAKLGDAVITENGTVYYINSNGNWKSWTDEEIGKKVKITATLITQASDLPTRNEKGEIQQGMEGDINYLFHAQREIYEQEITLVGKLIGINTSKVVGKSEIGAYGLLTDDRKVYYLEGVENWNLKDKFLNKRMSIKGVYTEKVQKVGTEWREDKEKGLIKRNGKQGAEMVFPTLTQLRLPELERSTSLVVVFKKEIAKETTQKILQYTDYPFWKGMDSSKGKAYYYKTGEKYHVIFPSEEEKQNFIEHLKNKPEIYEIYTPNWNLYKD